MIGSMLFLLGILIIFFGFLIIITGIALSTREKSESKRDYSNITDKFRRQTDFENIPYSERSPPEKSIRKAESKVKAGGVIMIGPVPIIFGSDKESAKTAAILAIIIMLLSLLIFRVSLF